MHRVQLIEIHDQNWFPRVLRDYVTDDLQMTLNVVDVYQPIVERLGALLKITGADRIVDLCSGAGGPWLRLHRAFANRGEPLPDIYLTDKYPNASASERLRSNSGMSFVREPVDALRIPAELTGIRTFFSSFHHFRPRDARAILQATVDQEECIAIVEAPSRHVVTMLLVGLVPFVDLALVPFFYPLTWWRLLWTYLIPVVPLVLFIDGIVSCLRTYAPAELEELTASVDSMGYRWEIGIEKKGPLRVPITYLIGYPEAPSTRSSSGGSAVRKETGTERACTQALRTEC